VRFDAHLRDTLTFYFLCSKAVFDKYRPLLNTEQGERDGTWYGYVNLEGSDWLLLSISFYNESLQQQFMAESDVITLPHWTENTPLPAAAVAKIRSAWPDAPLADMHALTQWVGPAFGAAAHHATLRVKRHQHRQTVIDRCKNG
jgi:hypothetical protein